MSFAESQPGTDWATGSFHNKKDTDYRDSPDTVFDNGEDLSAEEEAMEEDLTPEQVPGVEGVSENNPYGCQFCTKAFPRLSYLKIHEQVKQLRNNIQIQSNLY